MEDFRLINGSFDYEVSNLGNVRSLKYGKKRILKPGVNKKGYFLVVVDNKTRNIHQLVAESFFGHKRCGMELVVNHKDFNRQNNNVNNLEIVTSRANSSHREKKGASKYTGVSWHNKKSRWHSRIRINGKTKHLGYFKCEIEAGISYQNALNDIN